MELVWLLQGAVGLVGLAQAWLPNPGPAALAVIVALIVILVAMALQARRRRSHAARMQAARVRDEAAVLKDQLRLRLSEPC